MWNKSSFLFRRLCVQQDGFGYVIYVHPSYRIDPSHKSYNALDTYLTMQDFVTEMCTHVHITVIKGPIVRFGTAVLWYLCNRSIIHDILAALLAKWVSNGACKPGDLHWDYFPGMLSLSQITITRLKIGHSMMTSSNGNIFRVTGHLCGEFTGPRWIPRKKASDAELWCFLWSASE